MSLTLESLPAETQASRERLAAFAFAAADLLIETEADGRIVYAAGAFPARFGSPAEAFVGRFLAALITPADRSTVDLALTLLLRRGRLRPVVLRLANAQRTQMVLSGMPRGGAPGQLCVTFSALPASTRAERGGAAGFAAEVEAHLRDGREGGLGLLEVEDWNRLRQALPAPAEQALRAGIADALTCAAGPDAVAGELGEGRYGVLAPRMPDLAEAQEEIRRLLHAVQGEPPRIAAPRIAATTLDLSLDGFTPSQAVRALRYALTRFAQGGARDANRSGLRGGLSDFIAIARPRARALRAAIADRRFRLAFQPIVTLANGRVHHFEALLRPTATHGAPTETTQEFVNFAEAMGLSEELDQAVLERAASAAEAAPGVRIAVNISGISLESAPFRERMLATLAASPSRERLLVELTETADIDDIGAAAETIARLRDVGVQVCLDDFGAGSAAFRYLRELRVGYVKIDGAYVRQAPAAAREQGFVISMVELANFMGAKTIAEMIETEDQAQMMRDVGVEMGQGWLFGRPGALPGSV